MDLTFCFWPNPDFMELYNSLTALWNASPYWSLLMMASSDILTHAFTWASSSVVMKLLPWVTFILPEISDTELFPGV